MQIRQLDGQNVLLVQIFIPFQKIAPWFIALKRKYPGQNLEII